ncbi:MAG: YceI family protein [Bythopirellula sp.]|nr:YceI family protein [Bythopirellula sp.]
MKSFVTRAVVLLALAVASQPFAVRADSYALEPSHTSVIFGISHMGLSYTYGRFNQVAGNYVLDEANPAASNFQMTIPTASIDTNDAKRDDHLRGPDFFNAKEFPTITFQSTAVKAEKNDKGETIYQVTGDLNIHGVTRKVTLPLRLLKVGPGMQGEMRSGFLCETRLARSEFGMTNMIPGIGDDVAITISFEGVKQ